MWDVGDGCPKDIKRSLPLQLQKHYQRELKVLKRLKTIGKNSFAGEDGRTAQAILTDSEIVYDVLENVMIMIMIIH